LFAVGICAFDCQASGEAQGVGVNAGVNVADGVLVIVGVRVAVGVDVRVGVCVTVGASIVRKKSSTAGPSEIVAVPVDDSYPAAVAVTRKVSAGSA
jgi:hypothetical protein